MGSEKARIELRIDAELAAKMKKVAEGAEISVNQLVTGILHWAMAKAHVGEPKWDERKTVLVGSEKQAGCLWFGETLAGPEGDNPDRKPWRGEVYFKLDFTERRIVKED